MAGRVIRRFKENCRGFWKDYRWFIAVFVLALFCDAASTIHFMLREGPHSEMHLVIRFVSTILGPVAGPLFSATGKAVAGIIVGIYWRRFAVYIFVIASITSLFAAWYNIWDFGIYARIL